MAEDTEVLSFTLDIDGKRAQAQVAAVQKKYKREFDRIAKATKGVNVLTEKLLKVSHKLGTDYAKGLKLSYKQVDQLNLRLRTLNQQINENKAASISASGATLKGIKREIKEHEKELELLQEIGKLQKTANIGKAFEEATEEMGENLRREVEDAFKSIVKYKWSDAGVEVGEGITDALSGIGSRDMAGAAKGFLKGISGGFKGLGAAATRYAAKKQADPGASGFGKAMGKAMGKMGPMLETLSKLGPILGAVSGVMMAVVKLFLDAEAGAKQFNKDLLSSTSTSEYLASNLGNASAAAADLEETIREVRDAAFSLDNLDWGINNKDHLAVLNTLNAEGVSLKHMKDEAERAGKSMGNFSATMTHVAVAYSRNFGVSLNEISSLQAEMMTELGGSLASTTKDFAAMQMGAAEAGIASNKFFNIIKGVSSDLSLYNMRMEDAVHMLTLLGKVMSPRNAQKFLQTTMQGFKTMGRAEKLRMTLLAGQGATKDIVERDLNRKTKSLAEKIKDAMGGKGNVEDIANAIKAGGQGAKDIISKLPKEMQGEISEAASQIKIDSKRSKRGLFGLSTATGNLGAGGVFEMYKKSIGRFGGKKLEDAAGSLGGEMMAENLGISQEQLDQAIKFEQAIDDQKEALIAQGWDKKKVDSMETDEVLDTMSKEDKDTLLNAGKQIDYAKKQADLTSSLLDKLDTIMDYILNYIYDTLADIYSLLGQAPIFKSFVDPKKMEAINLRNIMKYNKKSSDPTVQAAYKKSGGDMKKMSAELVSGFKKQFEERGDTIERLEKQAGQTSDPKEKKKLLDQAAVLKKQQASEQGDIEHSARLDDRSKLDALGSLKGYSKDMDKVIAEARDFYAENGDEMGLPDIEVIAKNAGVKLDAEDKAAYLGALLEQGPTTYMNGEHVGEGGLEDDEQVQYLINSLDQLHKKAAKESGAPPEVAGESKMSTVAMPVGGAPAVGGGAANKVPVTIPTATGTGGTPATNKVPVAGGPPVPASSKDAPPTGKQAEASNDTLTDIHKEAVAAKKFDKGSGANSLKGKIEDATLESVRTALFEYYLYSGFDRKDVAAAMASGKSIKDITEQTMDLAKKQGSTFNPQTAGVQLVEPNAAGGTVMRPAPGEAFASVAPGETIVPKGGKGGAAVIQNFNGPPSAEFESYIKNGTIKLIAEYERRKKFQ